MESCTLSTPGPGADLLILTAAEIRAFRRCLRDWYRRARRDLPWRRSRDPWRVLVSEVMLQQTRVAAVIPYYERFLREFPTPVALAAATDEKLLAMWAGLGYYSRARNLREAARRVANRFPESYGEIRALPGVGDYTAAAVASIAFDLPHAVLDGNVARVLARLTGDEGDIKAPVTRQRFAGVAAVLLDSERPGDHNQAVMELGATLCLPRDPQCLLCPVASLCVARASNRQDELPRKASRREPVRIARTLLLIRRNRSILLRQRAADTSLMPGFWELPEPGQLPGARLGVHVGEFRHTITHHLYRFQVVEARAPRSLNGYEWVDDSRLPELPLATTVKKALKVRNRALAAGV
jgi:A/G-specific adenine glycosylase